MIRPENLTSENCFKALEAQYPLGFKCFLDWLDNYAEANNWDHVFNPLYRSERVNSSTCVAIQIGHGPKYRDLPLAMQTGIFIEFAAWVSEKYLMRQYRFGGDLRKEFAGIMLVMDQELRKETANPHQKSK